MDLLKNESMIIAIIVLLIVLIGLVIYLTIKVLKLNKKYQQFIKKIGEGKNIEEDLENYMYKVERVEKQNAELFNKTNEIDIKLQKCVQKVGIVRYNAFPDMGSDLSFAIALLDEKNDGIVLNGVYSREMSSIYAKPVEKGEPTYKASKEEIEAINIATKNK